MKIRVTYVTGHAPLLPWWRALSMTREEIDAYNRKFLREETVELPEPVKC